MKTKITLTIDSQLYNILVGLAREQNRSLSNYVENVLREHEGGKEMRYIALGNGKWIAQSGGDHPCWSTAVKVTDHYEYRGPFASGVSGDFDTDVTPEQMVAIEAWDVASMWRSITG